MNKTLGAVLYTRVSTGEQAKHGTSLESQLEACRAKAQSLGLRIVAEYEDGGVSGSFLSSREGMQAALADIREGRADTLICANISRYSRDVEHQQAIKKDVKVAGGRLVFSDMDFDDTPEGDMAFNMMGAFAEYERKVIRERMMKGLRSRAHQGIQPARSRSPYGYHVPTKDDIMAGRYSLEMLGKYQVIEEEAKIVRRIFAGYAMGSHSLNLLCQELNAEGVPTPQGGIMWRPPTIKAILTNPVHKGQPAFGRTQSQTNEARKQQINRLTGKPIRTSIDRRKREEGEWLTLPAPAIVSEEVWQAAQERRASNKSLRGGNPTRVRMLSGRIVCPACSQGMLHIPARPYAYYTCQRHREAQLVGVTSPCSNSYYSVTDTEQAVVLSLTEVAERPESVHALLIAYAPQPQTSTSDARKEIAAIDRAMLEIKQQESETVQAQIVGIRAGASPDAYASVFADLNARRKDLGDRRARLLGELRQKEMGTGKTSQPNREAIQQQALNDLVMVLKEPQITGEQKRNLIATVIDKVIPLKGGAEIVYLPGAFWFGEVPDTLQHIPAFFLAMQRLRKFPD